MKTLQHLLSLSPVLHRTGDGEATSYGLIDEALRYIDEHVGERSQTIETGAGLSTLLFVMKGAFHTSIMPDQELADRILAFCKTADIPTERLRFVVARSQDVLPRMEMPRLDFVLIDGDHAFPMPFIDWYYTEKALKVGGHVLVDDTEIWTGDVLKQFLLKDPSWSIVRDFSRTAIFRKDQECENKWWGQQTYVVNQSRGLMRLAKARRACELMKRGDFSQFFRKLIGAH